MRLHRRRAKPPIWRGRPDAERRYGEAIAEFRAQGNSLGAAKALVRLSEVQWFQGETRQAWTRLNEAVELLEREPSGPELAHAYSQIAREHMLSAHAGEALAWSEKALGLAEELGLGIETVWGTETSDLTQAASSYSWIRPPST